MGWCCQLPESPHPPSDLVSQHMLASLGTLAGLIADKQGLGHGRCIEYMSIPACAVGMLPTCDCSAATPGKVLTSGHGPLQHHHHSVCSGRACPYTSTCADAGQLLCRLCWTCWELQGPGTKLRQLVSYTQLKCRDATDVFTHVLVVFKCCAGLVGACWELQPPGMQLRVRAYC